MHKLQRLDIHYVIQAYMRLSILTLSIYTSVSRAALFVYQTALSTVYVCMYVRMYVRMCMVCVSVRAFMAAYEHPYWWVISIQIFDMCYYERIYQVFMHAHIVIYIYTHSHTRTHIPYIHTYIHTYINRDHRQSEPAKPEFLFVCTHHTSKPQKKTKTSKDRDRTYWNQQPENELSLSYLYSCGMLLK